MSATDETKSMKEKINKQTDEFEKMINYYLESNPLSREDRKTNELEVRFGINEEKSAPISKINFENVIQQLRVADFNTSNPNGMHSLRILSEYRDAQGINKMSNIRTEIVGVDLIQEYCRTNSLQKVLDLPSSTYDKIKFTQKTQVRTPEGNVVKPVDFYDHNFRVSYQLEQESTARSQFIREKVIKNWDNNKRIFRHLNRVQFKHSDPEFPILADISIVKNSTRTKSRRIKDKLVKGTPIPRYTIQEAEVFQNPETYEIELEIDNSKVGKGTKYDTAAKIMTVMRKCIRIILSGLQGTNYPISFSERDHVLKSYMKLIHGESEEVKEGEEEGEEGEVSNTDEKQWRVTSKDFIGPSSLTLQIDNIIEPEEGSKIPNIRNNYTVTDKADGERRLLFISQEGKIYMIDTNMNVIFSGAMTKHKFLFNSLLDGEHIKYDKKGKFINLFAAFDIYYIRGKSLREFAFYPGEDDAELIEEETEKEKDEKSKKVKQYRLLILNTYVEKIEHMSILQTIEKEKAIERSSCDFVIRVKTFYASNKDQTIFEACSNIISRTTKNDDLFDYNTDGLIFTPSDVGVGSDEVGKAGPNYKSTWNLSFKWKPAEFNTVDFLVRIKKNKKGDDEVFNVFSDGKNLEGMSDVKQFKTLELLCGFDQKKHGYLQPFQDMIDNNYPKFGNVDDESTYEPKLFMPTSPSDPSASYSNIYLREDGNRDLLLFTEEGEYFDDNMIIEFRYDITKGSGWRWIPLRVRYDKTNEFLSGMKNYGNAYHVANSNWHSIHNPITLEMITSGENIPQSITNEDVYYNRTEEKNNTRSLRDFHNLFVKRKLITSVSKRGYKLIDYAVGKAGDMSKWINAKLSFVFGIDISKDNIHNPYDGACARYLKNKKRIANMPDCIFVNGNTSLNIRNGEAMSPELGLEKDRQVTKAIFGTGPKDYTIIGRGVAEKYGIGKDGFEVSSCQFALHYMFANRSSLHGFMRNLAECTKMNGYFIGTCYDGNKVFDLLKDKAENESVTIMRGDTKIFELTKKYNKTGFPDDEMSLGYTINVYQETINKTFLEFLVNNKFLVRIMEDYGFILIPKAEANQMGLPNGMGSFKELFVSLLDEESMNPRKRIEYKTSDNMSPDEKMISFLNMYFVFKKVRSLTLQQLNRIYSFGEISDELEDQSVDMTAIPEVRTRIKKLKRPKITIETTQPIIMPQIEEVQIIPAKTTEPEPEPELEPEPEPEPVVQPEAEVVVEPEAEEEEEEIIIIKPKKSKKPVMSKK